MKGRVVKGVGGFYYVAHENEVYMGKARGSLKRKKNTLYVGDVVEFELDDNNESIVTELLERKNFLIRPPVSNLEMLVVVFAAAHPEVNFPVIDKLIAACEYKGIDVAVCITKKDMQEEAVLESYIRIYAPVYPTVAVNSLTGDGVSDLRKIISGKNVALAGPSGVGKSTLLNCLLGDGIAETGSISEKTKRGKHTTRHVEIFTLEDGTNVYDTPGFTSIDMPKLEALEVRNLFPEFRERRMSCRYSDCLHINEPECAVKDALSAGEISETRYKSYLAMIEEVKSWHK